jgi:hypothetical protein
MARYETRGLFGLSWRVIDNENVLGNYIVATCHNEAHARRIEDLFNGVNAHTEYWKNHCAKIEGEARKQQETLALRLEGVRKQRDSLSTNIDYLRKQRDSHVCGYATPESDASLRARILSVCLSHDKTDTHVAHGHGLDKLAFKYGLRRGPEQGRNAAPSQAAPVYVPNTPPEHVVLALSTYTTLVKERDEAIAKYEACAVTLSFVDGQWARTS